MREKPSLEAEGKRLSLDPTETHRWWVTDKNDDGWMRVKSSFPGHNGWVRASSDDWLLRRKMPELLFMDGLFGYLDVRTVVKGDSKGRQAAHWAQRALGKYENRVGERPSAGLPFLTLRGKRNRGRIPQSAPILD